MHCIFHIMRCFCTPSDNPIRWASSRHHHCDVRKEFFSAAHAAFFTSQGAFAHLLTTLLHGQPRDVVIAMSEMRAPDTKFNPVVIIYTDMHVFWTSNTLFSTRSVEVEAAIFSCAVHWIDMLYLCVQSQGFSDLCQQREKNWQEQLTDKQWNRAHVADHDKRRNLLISI